MTTAKAVKAQGATFLRGGAFKPRTSPYEFQGLAKEGLKLLAQAKKEYDLGIVTEVLSERDVELVVGVRRHPADRRAQRAEFLPHHRGGPQRQGHPAQARHEHAHRGMAARGRVRPGPRQPQRAPLRARHPHLRDLHAQHAGPLRRGDREEGIAPAGHHRPEPGRGPRRSRHRACARRRSRSTPTACSSRCIRIPPRRGATASSRSGSTFTRRWSRR